MAVSMGSALCVSPSSRDRPEAASDPEGRAMAPPTSRKERGVPEGGTKSPLASLVLGGGDSKRVIGWRLVERVAEGVVDRAGVSAWGRRIPRPGRNWVTAGPHVVVAVRKCSHSAGMSAVRYGKVAFGPPLGHDWPESGRNRRPPGPCRPISPIEPPTNRPVPTSATWPSVPDDPPRFIAADP